MPMPKLPRSNWKILRILRGHWRLFLSIAAGFALLLVLPDAWRMPSRLLIGWDTGIVLYLSGVLAAMTRFDLRQVRARAAAQDEGAILVLVLTVLAALASLVAIVALLGAANGSRGGWHGANFALAVLTILLSWCFIHFIFALHYTHEFYGEGRDKRYGGLKFPNDDRPDYWDFIYFSFVVGMTFQVSDVQVTSKHIRRTVVAHGMVSFFFNVAILALAVNIGSTMIS